MARELTETYPKYIDYFNKASKILGFDLREACFCGDEISFSRGYITQPGIVMTSIIAYDCAKSKGIEGSAVAGHSLGEYSAMYASGMVEFDELFFMLKERALAMDHAAKVKPGSMCAVVGIPAEEVEAGCLEIDEYVTPVNYNTPTQTVISGTDGGIDKAMAYFNGKGAKAIKLNINYACHCRFMQKAAEEFIGAIRNVHFHTPKMKFFSNVTGEELHDFQHMPELLAKHLISPVKFTTELYTMEEQGYDTFIECGPGRVLTGLVRKTLKDSKAMNIENMESLYKVYNYYAEMGELTRRVDVTEAENKAAQDEIDKVTEEDIAVDK